jgi:hypothetical protein
VDGHLDAQKLRAASSTKIGLAAFSSAKACSSSRLTITCVSVGTASRAISIRSSNHRHFAPVSSTEIRATERCEWGVANWPRVWRACSESSSEQGQVEE